MKFMARNVKTQNYWADEWSIKKLADEFGFNVIIISVDHIDRAKSAEDAYTFGYVNIISSSQHTEEDKKPYIIVSLKDNHYSLIKYKYKDFKKYKFTVAFPKIINLPSKLRFFARKELDDTKEEKKKYHLDEEKERKVLVENTPRLQPSSEKPKLSISDNKKMIFNTKIDQKLKKL